MYDQAIEKWYVYRSLNQDEAWGAIIIDNEIGRLPNIDFGMKVFAINEKEAITRAKKEYDKIHAYDSDKENVRRFAASALKHFIKNDDADVAAKKAINYSVALLKEYNKYFKGIEDEQQEILSDNAGTAREWKDNCG